MRKLTQLDGGSRPDELEALVVMIPDADKAEFIRTVFTLLLVGNVDGAQAHVDLRRGDIAPIEGFGSAEMVEVEDGDEVRRLRVGSPEYEAWLKAFESRSTWQDWFLFLHPEQERVVRADYPGVAQLSGVSGSGKTCVVVRRAMRLAEQGSDRVLILTLNRSLAGLLRQLVDAACADEAVRSRIEVSSFFELARTLLVTFEPENARQYEDVTWKLGEHVDEVFREYYRQWANNHDASVLLPLHKSLTARGVSGETYLREEFDWIRSAVPPDATAEYLDLERSGRKFPIPAERRRDLLRGLAGWEKKMTDVGVVDYLGLTAALARHIDKIAPAFTNVLVDEAQDFGTTELRVVRRLVPPGPNDIFLCGDIAQTVLPKHRSLTGAGLAGITRERIQQNYRNSREILAAAYDLLTRNLHEEMFESEDLEILDPRFANFSGPVPMALAAETLEEEIAYARAYAATRLAQDARTVCVAFAGFSSRDVQGFATRCGVTALDGAYDPSTDRLVFSDLEQTKGYEFDTLIIVGCCDGVLPAHDAPPEEAFRETCKLYVAMTRAKRELILSFHGAASPWIRAVSGTIATDQWASSEVLEPAYLAGVPETIPEIDPDTQTDDTGALTGLQYLYTSRTLSLSGEAQDKLIDLVDGKGARAAGGGRRLRWANVGSLAANLRDSRRHDNLLGPKVAEELRANLGLTSA
ncbi:3'-5' exonuclease [Microvirga yunnanensis]|uniref:3'-5' exonuclease n=1 Tax=Microvirga yunnanensis TaxID=2953740 RepID=UPI0021C79661|nr:3'-5' exonuclease [Microvirga sp. HBU65207]